MPSVPPSLHPEAPPVASTGVEGLDAILHGGLPREEMHLIQGTAGTGKSTLALCFLRAGAKAGEASLYLTLSQSAAHLERIARSHGWSLAGVTVHELSPRTVAERIAARQTILPTADVELGELFQDLADLVEQTRPRRAVIDSLSVLRLLAGGPQRYHREVVTLRQLFTERKCTLLTIADYPAEGEGGSLPEVDFHPLCGCVIDLKQEPRAFGDVRRRLRIVKARGLASNGGTHDYKIATGRMDVYPRLGAYNRPEYSEYEMIATDVASLDEVLGGGLERGTACLLVGPTGAGKSTVAALYADAAARRGGSAAVFLFDERPETFKSRTESFGMHVNAHIEAGRMSVQQLDSGEIAPGEFAQQIREMVETRKTQVVVIDSIAGYFAAMGSQDVLVSQLHELLTYLSRSGVLTMLIGSQEGLTSIGQAPGPDVSYLSDSIVVLGFYEIRGKIHRSFAAVKKRNGRHATEIHELIFAGGSLAEGSIRLQGPLRGLQRILLDNPAPACARKEEDDGE
ncbi:circadian clock protein KaiC [Nannocystis exedens]|uniref:Circadian clock protein KaiC n=1 Tax=Nannocystis exedens TaxID=54 RepID=A0A1I2FUL0_9BACT|nr:ATPase domain-containing protein [Nannocystis exedens]PCC73713.1 circadian clock protein KaiC [Nannocystis exedens]SFF08518.1 circadian clock protein KaiC [Nannocystis exedens]